MSGDLQLGSEPEDENEVLAPPVLVEHPPVEGLAGLPFRGVVSMRCRDFPVGRAHDGAVGGVDVHAEPG